VTGVYISLNKVWLYDLQSSPNIIQVI